MKIRNFTDIKSFLLENRTTKQTIFKNTFWLSVAGGANRALMLILLIYVARILGATEYGKFTFALAFVALFSVVFNFGLKSIVTREFARDKEREKEFSAILSLKILLGLVAAFLILVSSFFVTNDSVIQKVILILAIFTFIRSFSGIILAFFRARERMEYQAVVRILEALLMVGAGFFVIFNFPSIENLGYSYLFSVTMVLIVTAAILHFKIQPISFQWNKSIWKKFLAMSWPLALVTIFASIYNEIDSVMMGSFGQITQTGWYNAAFGIARASLIPAGFITASFYPVLSRAFKESKEKLQKIWNYQIELMIFLAVPITLGGVVLAPKIIEFIYDPSYFPSILVFQMLLVMTGIIFLYNNFYQILIVADQQKKLFWAILAGAIINIILNLILIPKYSLYGAAIATVVTHLLIFYLLVRFTLAFTSIKPFNLKIWMSLFGAIISAILMYFVISQPLIYQLHVLYLIFIGGGVYLVCFWSYKKLTSKILKITTINK